MRIGRSRRPYKTLVGLNKTSITLSNPYDLSETLYSGQAFRWEPFKDQHQKVWHEGVVDSIRIRIRQEGDTLISNFHPRLEVPSESTTFLESYLRISDNMSDVYRSMPEDVYLEQAVKQFPGLHILRQDPWECLVTFICSANNNIPRIRQLVNRICTSVGRRVEDNWGHFFAFPTASELSSFGEQNLRKLGLGFRAKYVAKAAVMESEGEIRIAELRGKSYEEVLNHLIKIPGVGDKVANCVMLFSLDFLNAFPVDVWVRRVLRESYLDQNGKLPDSRIRVWAQEYFGEYAGYVNQYLFHKRRLD